MRITYVEFLLFFLIIPLALLSLVAVRDRNKKLPIVLRNLPYKLLLGIHVLLALTYTTPWDNYLVASGAWYYDPRLVMGITIGWVPIEEYTFFILQTLLVGLWLQLILRHFPLPKEPFTPRPGLRLLATSVCLIAWLAGIGLLVSAWSPGTYLGLILAWALLPITFQMAFGADLLWHYRRPIFITLFSLSIYLGITDSLAIASQTWTISPVQSLNLYLAGRLPVEELLFFLVTNSLIIFGITLGLTDQSRKRVSHFSKIPILSKWVL